MSLYLSADIKYKFCPLKKSHTKPILKNLNLWSVAIQGNPKVAMPLLETLEGLERDQRQTRERKRLERSVPNTNEQQGTSL